MLPATSPRTAGPPPEAGREKDRLSCLGFRGERSPATALLWIASLQNWERTHFSGFKPPGLWYFVTAARGN